MDLPNIIMFCLQRGITSPWTLSLVDGPGEIAHVAFETAVAMLGVAARSPARPFVKGTRTTSSTLRFPDGPDENLAVESLR